MPIFIAFSLTSELAATTEPVVSRVPPIQAPATSSEDASNRATQGMRIIIGTATMRTSEMT